MQKHPDGQRVPSGMLVQCGQLLAEHTLNELHEVQCGHKRHKYYGNITGGQRKNWFLN